MTIPPKMYRLTPLRLVRVDSRYRKFYLCRCDCGKSKVIHLAAIRSGNTKSCGCLAIEAGRRRCLPPGEAAKRQVYANYRTKAKRARRKFEISLDQFSVLVAQGCFYCGASPSNRERSPNNSGDAFYNGIDRVDSDKGYVMSNVVSCCAVCNLAKRDMPLAAFRDWVVRISAMADQWGAL